jgi:hypothetical protein
MEKTMATPKWNNDLPITKYGSRGVDVPLDQALKNPSTVLNTTPKTYLPTPPNQMPASGKSGKK